MNWLDSELQWGRGAASSVGPSFIQPYSVPGPGLSAGDTKTIMVLEELLVLNNTKSMQNKTVQGLSLQTHGSMRVSGSNLRRLSAGGHSNIEECSISFPGGPQSRQGRFHMEKLTLVQHLTG